MLCCDKAIRVVATRQDDGEPGALSPYGRQNLPPTQPRHFQVRNDQPDEMSVGAKYFDGFHPVVGGQDIVAQFLQHDLCQAAHACIILDD